MSILKDGGSAFPVTPKNGTQYRMPGMTLRDYFAAAALQGVLASTEAAQGHKIHVQTLAANCYTISDAMLAERAKTKEDQS